METAVRLHAAQAEVARDRHRFRVLVAGRRFGKTVLSAEEMLGYALAGPDRQVAYIAPTYQQARDIAWAYLRKRLRPVTVTANDTRLEIVVRAQGGGTSTIKLRSWETVDTLRGQAFDFVVLDEVASYRGFWSGWEEVLRPTLADRSGHALFIGTPKGFNHFYDLASQEGEHDTWKTFRFTTYDNPLIPKEEIDAQRAQMAPDTFAQEFMADFRKAEGLVYPEFDRSRHVVDEVPNDDRTARRMAGVDFGFTNPTAALLVIEGRDGVFTVAEEWYRTGKTNSEVIEQVRAMRPHAVYPDPAEPDRIEEMRRAGLPVRDVRKDVSWGIDRVRRLFIAGRLKVHRSCQDLIAELEQYRWRESGEDRNAHEEPEKSDDHACDALRYVLAMASDDVADEPSLALYGTDWL